MTASIENLSQIAQEYNYEFSVKAYYVLVQTLESRGKFNVLLGIIITLSRHSMFVVQTPGILKYHRPLREMPNCNLLVGLCF